MKELKEIDEKLKKGGSVTVEVDDRLWYVVSKIKDFNMPLQTYESKLRIMSVEGDTELRLIAEEEIDRVVR